MGPRMQPDETAQRPAKPIEPPDGLVLKYR